MSFQMEVDQGRIRLWMHGELGPTEATQLREALTPMLGGRPREVVLELSERPLPGSPAEATLSDLQTLAKQQGCRMTIGHAGQIYPFQFSG